ncbi:MAG TPA: lasso peptide biosynthesis B2 protein [Thermoanaerobaculia bacterium]|nr:lasso peptide biosynthesis B2 protein [Thermoanaerobaculia bacterium]
MSAFTEKRLTAAEKRLAVAAWVLVPAVRLAVAVLPFRFVHRLAVRTPRRSRSALSPERIARAVHAVAQRLRGTTCLTEVLAAAYLCSRYGHAATLRLGVGRSEAGIAAHAWLESEGRAILGEPEPGTFVALG